MLRIIDTILFAAWSFVLWALVVIILVGVTCFRHGDLGPYPEADYIPWAAPVAMLVVYAMRRRS